MTSPAATNNVPDFRKFLLVPSRPAANGQYGFVPHVVSSATRRLWTAHHGKYRRHGAEALVRCIVNDGH